MVPIGMNEGDGRDPSGQALAVPATPASAVDGRSGFDPSRWHMRESAHYNGGKEWFGYGHQCIEQPRLYRLDRYTRKDRSITSTWSVDGEDCADLASAIERLKTEPAVTPEEINALALVPVEPITFRELRSSEAYKALPSSLSYLLSRKGLTWAENGTVRRTELGERIFRAAQGMSADAPKGQDQ